MIRPYAPTDLQSIIAIANAAWHDIYEMFHSCYGDALFAAIVPDAATAKGVQVQHGCETHPECVFVCEEEGVCVGFVTFRLDEKRSIGEIGNNGVDPAWRSRGIGQQMYAATLDHFRAAGMRFAKVHTGQDEAHAPARRAYERAGFDIQQKDVNYYMEL
jgi:ribosomal protein S18 acetylase RimI-like enzyme